MLPLAAIPFLDPEALIHAFGPWAVLGICAIIFAETGLLIGFIFPGDTLLILAGVLAATTPGGLGMPIVLIALFIAVAAFLGGELGYLIGHKFGPRIFERKDSGIFSSENVKKTNEFFTRFGSGAVILARFVPVIRTFLPLAAGIAHMHYRRYSLFNAIGAIAWGFGITMIGFGIGHIPPVARFVENYIDLILLGAVAATVIPIVLKVLSSSRKAKKLEEAHASPQA
ncbi:MULTISPECIES: DedA family protein [unclassified Frondihabitans]|uniref:DedA family protein n=1 Tax=unclassified Frondihabitans TaxID=2626248 RepID=UPI000F501755|nr:MULTISPECIES: VTT domain-containing protein [unclassified Frondihabitans]RPE76390.1 membrane-associated protein [Frondihabitans sp. PhB153]RPF05334.1 membrane-associated protein [Frondihabitans sp. PhB161]